MHAGTGTAKAQCPWQWRAVEPELLWLTSVSHSSCVRCRGGGQGSLTTCRQGRAPTHTSVSQQQLTCPWRLCRRSATVLTAGTSTQGSACAQRLCPSIRPPPLACSCRPCASRSCISSSSASWLMPCCGSDGSSHQASSTTPGRAKAAKLSMCPLVSSSLYRPLQAVSEKQQAVIYKQSATSSSKQAVSNKEHSPGQKDELSSPWPGPGQSSTHGCTRNKQEA